MTYHGFSFQLLAMNYGMIPKHKCCEFNVTMRLFCWGGGEGLRGSLSFPFLKERSSVKTKKYDFFLLLTLEFCV